MRAKPSRRGHSKHPRPLESRLQHPYSASISSRTKRRNPCPATILAKWNRELAICASTAACCIARSAGAALRFMSTGDAEARTAQNCANLRERFALKAWSVRIDAVPQPCERGASHAVLLASAVRRSRHSTRVAPACGWAARRRRRKRERGAKAPRSSTAMRPQMRPPLDHSSMSSAYSSGPSSSSSCEGSEGCSTNNQPLP